MPVASTADATIKALEARVTKLEKALQVSASQIVLQIGSAKIILTAAGNVQIYAGTTAQITSVGDMLIKTSGHLNLKGSTINEN